MAGKSKFIKASPYNLDDDELDSDKENQPLHQTDVENEILEDDDLLSPRETDLREDDDDLSDNQF
ncbi:MAG: hypothetical protein QMD65_02580 [Patescibacteria group bacterium]|nr:hypothetical protein [Patescibacteria group bacterium]